MFSSVTINIWFVLNSLFDSARKALSVDILQGMVLGKFMKIQ